MMNSKQVYDFESVNGSSNDGSTNLPLVKYQKKNAKIAVSATSPINTVNRSLKYRSDVDGLRAIAVMSVVMFHAGLNFLSGGYIGVDIFFVISGYLITTLIYQEMNDGRFTFIGFYKRRAARLLPALTITLLIVLIFGFIFYNNKTFDNLGKELFFSSFGAANILFAQGVNYFAQDVAYQPLIHLWSLGVEEQFYFLWPILLLITFSVSKKFILPLASGLFIISLLLSIVAVEQGLTKGYFLLHFRAFELLIGVITALFLLRAKPLGLTDGIKQLLCYLGMAAIILPMFLLNDASPFPGYNALWPCLGTALIIAFPSKGLITKLLSHRVLVFIGLISYPLYLYHQPLISFLYFFDVKLTAFEMFCLVIFITGGLAWLTYRFIELPIRKLAHDKNSKKSKLMFSSLWLSIPLFAVIGIGIAKSGGLEQRFKYLNPFALAISQAHSTTFHDNFKRGFIVKPTKQTTALFVGDSVLQHYILPMQMALNLANEEIDTVTRGGCVLLKGVDFIDKFSDISCNDMREKLYSSEKRYDYVIISQAWHSYDDSVRNFAISHDSYEKWSNLLTATVEHFLTLADQVIIVGAHPSVTGTLAIQPSVTINKAKFLVDLKKITITNESELQDAQQFFLGYEEHNRVSVIEPYRIFCTKQCVTSNDNWSYFSDNQHVSVTATGFIKERIVQLLRKEQLTVNLLL